MQIPGRFEWLIVAALSVGAFGVLGKADDTASIRQVQAMPNIPSPCTIRDWRQVAIDLDKLLFNPNAPGQFMPLFHLVRDHNNKVIGFGFPDYVGDIRQSSDGSGAG